MSYKEFIDRCKQFGAVTGNGCRFSHNEEIGRHKATFDDGTWITGNSTTRLLTIRWASGHMATVRV